MGPTHSDMLADVHRVDRAVNGIASSSRRTLLELRGLLDPALIPRANDSSTISSHSSTVLKLKGLAPGAEAAEVHFEGGNDGWNEALEDVRDDNRPS